MRAGLLGYSECNLSLSDSPDDNAKLGRLIISDRRGEGIRGIVSAQHSQVRALVARNPLFAAALAAGAVPAAAGRCSATRARCGSLIPSLTWALRCGRSRILSRTIGYSLFLRVLEPFHSLTLVTGVQHLMGLGIAVMVYALARRNGVPRGWATAATLPVLLDGFEIEDEHMVMAEALFTFLVMVAMLLMLWRGRVPWSAALLAGVLAGCAVDVRTAGAACAGAVPRRRAAARPPGCRGGRVAGLARLAGGGRDGSGLRDAGGCLRGMVPLLDRQLRADPRGRALFVGAGVLVRGVPGDQAAGRRAEGVPAGTAVEPDAAG